MSTSSFSTTPASSKIAVEVKSAAPKKVKKYEIYDMEYDLAESSGSFVGKITAFFKRYLGTIFFFGNLTQDAPPLPKGYAIKTVPGHEPPLMSLSDDPERAKFNDMFRLKVGKDGNKQLPNGVGVNFAIYTQKPNNVKIEEIKRTSKLNQSIDSTTGERPTLSSITSLLEKELTDFLVGIDRLSASAIEQFGQLRILIDSYKSILAKACDNGFITKKNLIGLVGGAEGNQSGLLQKKVYKRISDLFKILHPININNLIDFRNSVELVNYSINAIVDQEIISIEDGEKLWDEFTSAMRGNRKIQEQLISQIDQNCRDEPNFYFSVTLVSEYFRQNNLIADVGFFEQAIIEEQTAREVSHQAKLEEIELERKAAEGRQAALEQERIRAEEERKQAEEARKAQEANEERVVSEVVEDLVNGVEEVNLEIESEFIRIREHTWELVVETEFKPIYPRQVTNGTMKPEDLAAFKLNYMKDFTYILELFHGDPESRIRSDLIVSVINKSSREAEQKTIRFEIYPSEPPSASSHRIHFDDGFQISFDPMSGFTDPFYLYIQERLRQLAPNEEHLQYKLQIYKLSDPADLPLD